MAGVPGTPHDEAVRGTVGTVWVPEDKTRGRGKLQPTRGGYKLDSFLLSAPPLVLWAMRERPYMAPGTSPAALGPDHGPVVLSIPLAVATKERITRLAYSYAQGRLDAIRPDLPRFRKAAAAVLQRACDDPALKGWLSSDQDTATICTPEV